MKFVAYALIANTSTTVDNESILTWHCKIVFLVPIDVFLIYSHCHSLNLTHPFTDTDTDT